MTGALDTATPVVVLGVEVGGLAVARSLGRLGVPVYGIHPTSAAGLGSRYWTRILRWDPVHRPIAETLALVERLAADLGRRAILIPTVDAAAAFVADHAAAFGRWFDFPHVDPVLLRALMNKQELAALAARHGLPTAQVSVPRGPEDVAAFAEGAVFPVVVKGIDPTRRHGKLKAVVGDRGELMRLFAAAAGDGAPNLMLQEYIPGDDTTGWTFYGYFDAASRPQAAWTARKIRLAPANTGVIALGVVDDIPEAREACAAFMRAVGYCGPVNIGGKFDRRDGRYKVLDVNARLGASFRLCVADDGTDVVRVMYRDLTGQPAAVGPAHAGRRWLFDEDLFAARAYRRAGTLSFSQWLRSLRGVDEWAFWAREDPKPFLHWLFSRLKHEVRARRGADA